MDSNNEAEDRSYEDLKLEIARLEALENTLISEKNQMLEDFNTQRAKLKELYLQKEDELRQGVVGSSELIDELEEMKIRAMSLEGELERVRSQQYADEHKNYCAMAASSQKMNDKFLKIQQRCLSDIHRLKSFLSKDQLRQFYELKEMEKIPSMLSSNESKDIYGDDSYLKVKIDNKSADLNLFELGKVEEGKDSIAESSQFNHADDMPQLTDDQKRALSGLYTVNPDVATLEPSSQNEVEDLSPIFVSKHEFDNLNLQFEKCLSSLMEPCQSCAELEISVKKLESELCKKDKICDVLNKAAERQIEDLNKETLYRKKSESKWIEMVQEFQEKEKLIHSRIENISSGHTDAINQSKCSLRNYQQQLKKLTDKRELVNKELIRLQLENDKLIGKHSKNSQEMQNEIINLPDSIEEMHLLLLKYREDVIAAKVAKETLEESLNSKILFLKDQLLSEQHEKSLIEDKLSHEVEQLRDKLSTFEEQQSTIELDKNIRLELEAQLRDREQNIADTSEKYTHKVSKLKEELDDFNHTKMQQTHENLELKNRISTLQHDLETSEGVQRDFVRLSQSLQVQLERIRQSEKEVRWQHEEDVDECTSCKQKFTAVGRRKHHCRHCGKIFCNECCNHGVPSGPNRRISKVCDVCHTLLVADATPFFSSDPPNIVD